MLVNNSSRAQGKVIDDVILQDLRRTVLCCILPLVAHRVVQALHAKLSLPSDEVLLGVKVERRDIVFVLVWDELRANDCIDVS